MLQEQFLDETPENRTQASCWKLVGRLDVAALERAIQVVYQRHDALRTTFLKSGDEFLQKVALSPPPLKISVVDLRHLPLEQREWEIQKLASETCRPYDMEHGPLIRTLLARVAEDEHVFGFTAHHIIIDVVSYGIIRKEFTELYRAFTTATSPQLETPFQYSEFVHAQRRRLDQDQTLSKNMAYWRDKLAQRPPCFTLGRKRPQPRADKTFPAGTHIHPLPGAVCEATEAFRRREGTSTFRTLLATFFTLLHRVTGKTDIMLGSPIAGRDAQTAYSVGCYTNTIPMRVDLSGNPTFRELLHQIHVMTTEAYAHSEFNNRRLWQELWNSNDGDTALYATFFNFHGNSTTFTTFTLEGLDVTALPLGFHGVYALDLHFMLIQESKSKLTLFPLYNAAVLCHSFIARLMREFERILAFVVSSPDLPIGSIPVDLSLADNSTPMLIEATQ
jgi:hypothetical protein